MSQWILFQVSTIWIRLQVLHLHKVFHCNHFWGALSQFISFDSSWCALSNFKWTGTHLSKIQLLLSRRTLVIRRCEHIIEALNIRAILGRTRNSVYLLHSTKSHITLVDTLQFSILHFPWTQLKKKQILLRWTLAMLVLRIIFRIQRGISNEIMTVFAH